MSDRLPCVSRRSLLKSALVALPALAGAEVLAAWSSAPEGGVAAAADQAAPAGYDPAAHDWAYAVDTTRCIGCGLCVEACKLENGVPLDPEFNRTWIERHTVMNDGTLVIDSPEGGIDGFPSEPEGVDEADVRRSYFVPRLCMQCDNSPCTTVCPVGATYRTEDGVILVDADRCIGCGYCVVSCPYGARYMIPAGEQTPQGWPGVADKCTWCYHRISRGERPACVEVCPTDTRIFGDLNDPESPVSVVLREQQVTVMRPEVGTRPQVFYLGLESEAP